MASNEKVASDKVLSDIKKAFDSLALVLKNHGMENCDMFTKDEIKNDEAKLYIVLRQLASAGKICDAENLLFEILKTHTTLLCLKTARLFYRDINTLNDEQLEKCNFSRQEILDGMWDAERVFMKTEEDDAVG